MDNVIDNRYTDNMTSKVIYTLYIVTIGCKPSIFRKRFLSPWFSATFEVILATLNKNYATEDDDNEKENSNSNS